MNDDPRENHSGAPGPHEEALEALDDARVRHPWMAGVLTVLLIGLGHVYVCKAVRGAFFFAWWWLLFILLALMGALVHFWGLVVFMGVLIGWTVVALVDAWRWGRVPIIKPCRYRRGWVLLLIFATVSVVVSELDPRGLTGVQAYRVPSGSMEPGLYEGEHFMVRLPRPGDAMPSRGDLVVFEPPVAKGAMYVKRVVGVPGDTLQMRRGILRVNGERVTEEWAQYTRWRPDSAPLSAADFGPVVVRRGRLFVMGDNVWNSVDSRRFGAIRASGIAGTGRYVYLSLHGGRVGMGL